MFWLMLVVVITSMVLGIVAGLHAWNKAERLTREKYGDDWRNNSRDK